MIWGFHAVLSISCTVQWVFTCVGLLSHHYSSCCWNDSSLWASLICMDFPPQCASVSTKSMQNMQILFHWWFNPCVSLLPHQLSLAHKVRQQSFRFLVQELALCCGSGSEVGPEKASWAGYKNFFIQYQPVQVILYEAEVTWEVKYLPIVSRLSTSCFSRGVALRGTNSRGAFIVFLSNMEAISMHTLKHTHSPSHTHTYIYTHIQKGLGDCPLQCVLLYLSLRHTIHHSVDHCTLSPKAHNKTDTGGETKKEGKKERR